MCQRLRSKEPPPCSPINGESYYDVEAVGTSSACGEVNTESTTEEVVVTLLRLVVLDVVGVGVFHLSLFINTVHIHDTAQDRDGSC